MIINRVCASKKCHNDFPAVLGSIKTIIFRSTFVFLSSFPSSVSSKGLRRFAGNSRFVHIY